MILNEITGKEWLLFALGIGATAIFALLPTLPRCCASIPARCRCWANGILTTGRAPATASQCFAMRMGVSVFLACIDGCDNKRGAGGPALPGHRYIYRR